MADVLRAISALVKPGGHIGFVALTQPFAEDGRLREHAMPHALAVGGFAAALRELAGLEPSGPIDPRLTPRTLDRTAAGDDGAGPPALVLGVAPELEAPGVWSLVNAGQPADWIAFKAAMEAGTYGAAAEITVGATQSRLFTAEELRQLPAPSGAPRLGNMFDALTPAAGLTRSPLFLRVPSAYGQGIAAVASLGRVPAGHYELEIDVEISALARPGLVLAVGVASPGGLISEQAVNASDPGSLRVLAPLEIGKAGAEGVSALLKDQGAADLDILSLTLR
jgi:hypothetical protein